MSKLVMLDANDTIVELKTSLDTLHASLVDASGNFGMYKPTMKHVLEIVSQVTKKIIGDRCNFPVSLNGDASDVDIDTYITNSLFFFKDKLTKKEKRDIESTCEQIFNYVYGEIIHSIKKVVKNNSYYEWQVITIGRNVALIQGNDFRIKEYHRLTNTDYNHQSIKLDIASIVKFLYYTYVRNGDISEITASLIIQKMIAEEVLSFYPNVELISSGYGSDVDNKLNEIISNLDVNFNKSIRGTIKQIIETYNYYEFTKALEEDKFYTLEINGNNLIFNPVDSNSPGQKVDYEMRTLVMALLNGDYLPPDERKVAEDYLAANQEMFLY